MAVYRVYDENEVNSYLLVAMIMLIFVGLMVALVLYVGAIILAIFLSIGAIIGFVYAMIVYVKAFIEACKSVGGVRGKSGFSSFLRKWLYLIGKASLNAFKANFTAAHNALIKSSVYKLLSFRKWMWIIVAPSELIFGTVMIVFVVALQIAIAASAASLIALLILAALCIFIVVGIIYSVGKVSSLEGTSLSYNNPFGAMSFERYYTFSDLLSFPKEYFNTIFRAIKDMWRNCISTYVTNTASAKGFGYLNIGRHYLLISSIVMVPMMALFTAVTFVLLSVLFPVLFIIEFFWTLIALILK